MTQTSHAGRCHCGAVHFAVNSELDDPLRCNCSFCRRRGAIVQKVPHEKFRLLAGENDLHVYGNREFSRHLFCRHCGIHVFTRIISEGEPVMAVNLACLDGVDLASFTPREFDGATLL